MHLLLGGSFAAETLGQDVYYALESGGSDVVGATCPVADPCTVNRAIMAAAAGQDTVAVRVRRNGGRALVVSAVELYGKAVNFAVYNEDYGLAANYYLVDGELELRGTVGIGMGEAIGFGPYESESKLTISASRIGVTGSAVTPNADDPSAFAEFRTASVFRGNIVIGQDATIDVYGGCPTFENLQIARGAVVSVEGTCTAGLGNPGFADEVESTTGIYVWNVLDIDGELVLGGGHDLHLIAPRPNSRADSAYAGTDRSLPRAEISGTVTSSDGRGTLYIQVQEEVLTDTTFENAEQKTIDGATVDTLVKIVPTYLGWQNEPAHAYHISGSGRIDLDIIKTTQAGVRLDVDFGSGATSANNGGVLYAYASNVSGDFENNGYAQTEFKVRVVISNNVGVKGPTLPADGAPERRGIGSANADAGGEDLPQPMLECYDHSDRLQGQSNNLYFGNTSDGYDASDVFPRLLGSRGLTGGIYFRGRGSTVSGVVELEAGIKRTGVYNDPGDREGAWEDGDEVVKNEFTCYGGIYFMASTSVLGDVVGDDVTHLMIDDDVTLYGPYFDVRNATEVVVRKRDATKNVVVQRGDICASTTKAPSSYGKHLVFAGSETQTLVGNGGNLKLGGIGLRVDKATSEQVYFNDLTVSTMSVDIKGGMLTTNGKLDVHNGYLFINQDQGSVGDLQKGTGNHAYAMVSPTDTVGIPAYIVYTGSLASMGTGDELYEKMWVDEVETWLGTSTTKLAILTNITVGSVLRLSQGTLEIPSGITLEAPTTVEVGNGYVDEDGTGIWSLSDSGTVTFRGKGARTSSSILPSYTTLSGAQDANTASYVYLDGCPETASYDGGFTITLQKGHTPVRGLAILNRSRLDLNGNVLVARGNVTVGAMGRLCDSLGSAPCTGSGANHDLMNLSGALEAVHFSDTPETRAELAQARASYAASRGSAEMAADSIGAAYFYAKIEPLRGDPYQGPITVTIESSQDRLDWYMPMVKIGTYTQVTFSGSGTYSNAVAPVKPNMADKIMFPGLMLAVGEKTGSGGHVEFEGFDHVMVGDDAVVGHNTKLEIRGGGGHPQSTFMVGGDLDVGGTIAVNGNVLAVSGDYNQGSSLRPVSDVWLQGGTHYQMGDFHVGVGFHPDTTHIYALQAPNTAGDYGNTCTGNTMVMDDYTVNAGLIVYGDYMHYGAGDAFDASQTDVLGLRGTVTFIGNDTSMVSHSGAMNSFCNVAIMSGPSGSAGMVMMGSDVMQNKYGELTLKNGVVSSGGTYNSWMLANEAIEDTLVGRVSIGADEPGVVRYGSRDSYVDGYVTRSVSVGNQGGGVVTGGYLFPVGSADESGPDYYRPLIMQFPADLGSTRMATVGFMADAKADSMDWPAGNLSVDGADGMLTLDNVADLFWKVEFDAVPAHEPNIRIAADELPGIFNIKGLRIVQWNCDGTNPRLAGVYDLESDPSDDASFAVNDYVAGVPNLTQESVNVEMCNIFGIAANFLENPFIIVDHIIPLSAVQFINNVAGATVDLYIDDFKVEDDFAFQTARAFGVIWARPHVVDIVAANAPDNSQPLVSLRVRFRRNMNYHVIAHGNLDTGVLEVFVREDVRVLSTTSNKVEFYFVHGASDLGSVNIRLVDPIDNTRVLDLLASNFWFDEFGPYISLDPGEYNFEVAMANNDTKNDIFRLETHQYSGLAFVLNLSGPGKSNAEGVTIMGVPPDGNPFFPQVFTGTQNTELPTEFALLGNYPNPFNPSTRIEFDLPEAAEVSTAVFDMLGRNVMTLPSQEFEAGASRSIELNAISLASGNYLYQIVAKGASGRYIETGRMVLVK